MSFKMIKFIINEASLPIRVFVILNIKLMKNQELSSWEICNPDNFEDQLPMPYRLIDQVLQQTILYQLSLSLHQIQQKKKDSNYEGEVKQYVAQGSMDIQNICCLSSKTKSHNHLLAGDKCGNLYLLDPAKKTVFFKKQIATNKRIVNISQTLITDGQTMITTIAVILNAHPTITILRYKHSQPKLFITHQVCVNEDDQNMNQMPFDCQFQDSGRLLIVKTYEGSILGYNIPEVSVDIDTHTKTSSIPMLEEQVKKLLKYPLKMVAFETQVMKIKQKVLEVKFQGMKLTPKYSQLMDRLKKKKKQPQQTEAQPAKKDAKKKDDKKPQPLQQKPVQENLQFNQKIKKKDFALENTMDNTQAYPQPKFKPYVYFLNGAIALPKTRYFQKGTIMQVPNKIIYGWTNTKQFYTAEIRNKIDINDVSDYLYIAYFQQKVPQNLIKQKNSKRNQNISLQNVQKLLNLSAVKCVDLSQDQLFLAAGLADGTVAIWNAKTGNSQMVSDKHQLPVTTVKIFESWKVISGSQKGSVHIDNILQAKNQMKRTNIFESKVNYPITNLQVSELGLAFALDSHGNLRIYDLWRGQKISRVQPCTSFALVQEKGRRWLPANNIKPCETLYTNRDFTIIISTNWPNVPVRIQDATQQQIKRLELYQKNPWKCPHTNVHIIRNFQLILQLFQGLQGTYKKGYERKKIENLYSNLQFTQLYDRNFDIPDFGRTTGLPAKKSPRNRQSNMNRSSFSSINSQGNKTNKSNASKSKSKSKSKLNPGVSATKLTKQILHPQKFLLQRRVIKKKQIITEDYLTQLLREQHKKKERREIILNNDISKMGL